VVDNLSEIDHLQHPKWGQKYYIAFDDESGERRFTISTRPTIFKIKIRETVSGPEERGKMAERIGIPESEVTRRANSRGDPRIQIRIDPDYDIDVESLRKEVEQLISLPSK